jgi:hypothetical protein
MVQRFDGSTRERFGVTTLELDNSSAPRVAGDLWILKFSYGREALSPLTLQRFSATTVKRSKAVTLERNNFKG